MRKCIATAVALFSLAAPFASLATASAAPQPAANVTVEYYHYQNKDGSYTTGTDMWYYDQASSGWTECTAVCNDGIKAVWKKHRRFFGLYMAQGAMFLDGQSLRISTDQTVVGKPWHASLIRRTVYDRIDGIRERETISNLFADIYDPAFAEPPASPCGPNCGK